MPTARLRSDAPTSKVRNTDSPVARGSFSNVQMVTTTESGGGGGGIPMGLLLTLTYSTGASVTTTTYSPGGEGPYVRIRNND